MKTEGGDRFVTKSQNVDKFGRKGLKFKNQFPALMDLQNSTIHDN